MGTAGCLNELFLFRSFLNTYFTYILLISVIDSSDYQNLGENYRSMVKINR